jgi:hypothetical protein
MGSMLWAVDMLMNDMIQPMFKAYSYNQYDKAAHLLKQLNSFLCGYGEGIDDLPAFADNVIVDIHDRINPQAYYQNYYETYSQDVLKHMGQYIKKVLESIKLSNQFGIIPAASV